MSETTAVEKVEKADKAEKAKVEKPKKKSWFKGLRAEFKKIIWPDKKTLVKQTVAVILCSVILGAIIKVIDEVMQYGINLLVK